MTTNHTFINQPQDTDMTTTILVKQEIDLATDREINTILERFLIHRTDARASQYERQGVVIHHVPGATMDCLVEDDDTGRAALERIGNMGLIELDWDRVDSVLGQSEPVVWITEAGLIFLAEKEARRREASKPTGLDILPF
jgi:hypothetical protein